MKRIRETHLLEHSTLQSAIGKLADVVTYKTRTPGRSWKYATMIIGYGRRDGQDYPLKALHFEWSNAVVARASHEGLCESIHREQTIARLQ